MRGTDLFPASAFPKSVPGTDGHWGRHPFRDPGFAQTDRSLSETFQASEHFSPPVQVDAFAFYQVNRTDPIMDLATINFGKSIATNTPRLYQLGVRVPF